MYSRITNFFRPLKQTSIFSSWLLLQALNQFNHLVSGSESYTCNQLAKGIENNEYDDLFILDMEELAPSLSEVFDYLYQKGICTVDSQAINCQALIAHLKDEYFMNMRSELFQKGVCSLNVLYAAEIERERQAALLRAKEIEVVLIPAFIAFVSMCLIVTGYNYCTSRAENTSNANSSKRRIN